MTDAIPTLRQFLASGGDPDATAAEQMAPRERAQRGEQFRQSGEAILADGEPDDLLDPGELFGMRRLDGVPVRLVSRAHIARRELWPGEVHTDDELRRQLIDNLPADLREQHERAMHEYRHPFRLVVETPEHSWKCMACGAGTYNAGEGSAFTIEPRNAYGKDLAPSRELTFCLECVTGSLRAQTPRGTI